MPHPGASTERWAAGTSTSSPPLIWHRIEGRAEPADVECPPVILRELREGLVAARGRLIEVVCAEHGKQPLGRPSRGRFSRGRLEVAAK